MKRLDLTGEQFGRWRVLALAERSYQTMWMCACSCGTEQIVSGANLRSGKSASCGCLRDELRPTYAQTRDFRGAKNPRAQINIQRYGAAYVPSNSLWYRRASGIFYAARKSGTKLQFDSVVELAAYVKSIAPDRCPVFGKRFTSRGAGFSKWAPSIDKIDPKKGYVRGNIQVISMLANCMKRDATKNELELFATWVLNK